LRISLKHWRDAYSSFVEGKTRVATAAVPALRHRDRRARSDTPGDRQYLVGVAIRRDPSTLPSRPRRAGRSARSSSVQSVDGKHGSRAIRRRSPAGDGQTPGLRRPPGWRPTRCSPAGTVRGGNILLSVWHPALVDLRRTLGLPRHPVQVSCDARRAAWTIDGGRCSTSGVPVVVLTRQSGRLR